MDDVVFHDLADPSNIWVIIFALEHHDEAEHRLMTSSVPGIGGHVHDSPGWVELFGDDLGFEAVSFRGRPRRLWMARISSTRSSKIVSISRVLSRMLCLIPRDSPDGLRIDAEAAEHLRKRRVRAYDMGRRLRHRGKTFEPSAVDPCTERTGMFAAFIRDR